MVEIIKNLDNSYLVRRNNKNIITTLGNLRRDLFSKAWVFQPENREWLHRQDMEEIITFILEELDGK